jgi:hypothetical protein
MKLIVQLQSSTYETPSGNSFRASASVRAKSTAEHGDPWGTPQFTTVWPAGLPLTHMFMALSASQSATQQDGVNIVTDQLEGKAAATFVMIRAVCRPLLLFVFQKD